MGNKWAFIGVLVGIIIKALQRLKADCTGALRTQSTDKTQYNTSFLKNGTITEA